MPSLMAQFTGFMLRTTGVYKKSFSGGPGFAETQAKMLAIPSAPSPKNRKVCTVSSGEFQGRTVWTLAPKDRAPTAHVLFWHGGGYVFPPAAAHWDCLTHMASVHDWHVTAPLYPLAPMSQAEAVTGFALDFYRHYVAERAGGAFTMAGDSAGGGLSAATVMLARDAGLPLPEKLILICPWLEAAPDKVDQIGIERFDAILTRAGIRDMGQFYAGPLPLTDPRVSPITGDWSGLPPILCFAGGYDILVTDSRALKAKLPAITLDERAKMIHDWPIFFFPESRDAQAKMAAFAASA